jgi:hypothetical protein
MKTRLTNNTKAELNCNNVAKLKKLQANAGISMKTT